jgi:hypothetical protein
VLIGMGLLLQRGTRFEATGASIVTDVILGDIRDRGVIRVTSSDAPGAQLAFWRMPDELTAWYLCSLLPSYAG